LRAKTAAEIVSAPSNPEGDIGFAASMPQPNIDGHLLAESPASAFLGGRINAMDAFIGGTNQDEATLFTRSKTIATVDDYRAALGTIVPAHVDEALTLYPADGTTYATPKDAYDAFVTDLTFVCPTRTQLSLLAIHGVRTYQYQFEKLTAFGRVSKLGVFHASELPFVFGNLTDTSGTSVADRNLAAAMGGAWTRFAKVGDPNDDSGVWPVRTAGVDGYLRINDVSAAAFGLHQAKCDAMASWFP
jgi:para-nitrobenzyl esterase